MTLSIEEFDTHPLVTAIGKTPIFSLPRISAAISPDVFIAVKGEWANPGGSIKDRPAKAIVRAAIATGKLQNKSLLDASSGNTGIAYAMLGAALGFKVTLCLPQNANIERQRSLRALGCTLVLTDPNDGSDGAILEARKMVSTKPEAYFYADQYSNENNWKAHYQSTGPEIWEQSQGKLSHVITGLGTTGTCMGLSRYFREKHPEVQVVAVEPDSPFHGFDGLKHMETALVPGIYDKELHHRWFECATEAGFAAVKRVATEEGLLMGWSSGAALSIAIKIAEDLSQKNQPAHIVAIAPDGANRYLSEHIWDEL